MARVDRRCPHCGGLIVKWAAHIDVGYCPLGHRVTGTELFRAPTTYEENMGDHFTPADELIKLRDAGFITDAEARLVVADMFPQIKRLEDARRLVAEADASEA